MSTFKSFAVLAMAAASMAEASRLPHGAAHLAHHMARRNAVVRLPTTTTITAPADQCPFDTGASTNMAVYWGQGANQQRLRHFCDDANIDIIPIGFLNQFPDQTGGYPGSNFGNQCGDEVYKNVDGSDSQLKSDCPNIGPDIIYCQSVGKKILLSLGGAVPDNQVLNNDESAEYLANFVWRAFGPNKEGPDSTFPRPFGDASVDGFDLDIEDVLQQGEDSGDLDRGYGTLVDVLRSHYSLEPREYYISGAPQCVVPDAHLAKAIQSSHFDFLFVQFYNTPECSARAYFDHNYGSTGKSTDISFDQWVDFVNQAGSQAKLFLGLPAAPSVVIDPVMYLNPEEAKTIIDHFQCKYPERFGGVMVYEATASENNAIDGNPYADVLKKDLEKSDCANNSLSIITPPVAPSTSRAPTSALASTSAPTGTFTSVSAPLNSGASSGVPPYSISGTGKYPLSLSRGGSSGFLPSSGIPIRPSGTSRTYPMSSGATQPVIASSGMPIQSSGPIRSYTMSAAGTTKPIIPTGSGISYGTRPSIIPTGTGSPSSLGTSINNGSVGPSSRPSSGASGLSSMASGGGTLPAIPTSSNVPYPLTNSSAPAFRRTTSLASQSTISSQGNGASATTVQGSGASTSSMAASGLSQTSSGASGVPVTAAASIQSAVSTAVTSAYVTTSPVTRTVTSGGSQVVQTIQIVSTVYRIVTSTICTKCVAPSTTAAPTAPASIQSITTTVVTYVTTTICPVTQTVTSNGVPVVMTTSTTSTITTSSTSTITLSPPTTVAVTASISGSGATGSTSGVSASSNGNLGSSSNGSPASQGGNTSQGQASNASQGQGSNAFQGQGSNASQGQGSNFFQGQASNASQGQGSKASQGQSSNASQDQSSNASQGQGSNASQGQSSNASQDQSSNASQGQGSNASPGQSSNASQGQGTNASQGQGSRASQGQASNASQGKGSKASQGQSSNASQGQARNASQDQGSNASQGQGQQAPAGNAPASSAATATTKSPKTMKIVETVVPKPVYSYQTANSAPSAAPFPQGNNGTTAGSTATGTMSSGLPASTSPMAFTGAGSRLSGGFFGVLVGLLAIELVL